MIQKLRAVLQSPVLTALPFPPTAPVALEVLTFAMLSERNMPQGLHKHIASLWSGHLALCCRLQNSDTERSQLSVRAHLQQIRCQHVKPLRSHAVRCHLAPGLCPCFRGSLGSPPGPSMSSPSCQAEGSLSAPPQGASSSHSLWRSHLHSVFITFFHASVTGLLTVHLQKAILFEGISCRSCPPISPNSAPKPRPCFPTRPAGMCAVHSSTLDLGCCPAHQAQHTLTHKSSGIPSWVPKFTSLCV